MIGYGCPVNDEEREAVENFLAAEADAMDTQATSPAQRTCIEGLKVGTVKG
jgi:hypothetical protein